MPITEEHRTPTGLRITRARDAMTLDAARRYLRWRTQDDYGYGHVPEWHQDIEHAHSTYVLTPRQALWVALAPIVADDDPQQDEAFPQPAPPPGTLDERLPGQPHLERVVGTVAIRAGGPRVPPHPPFFAERYPDPGKVAQLVRLMVAPEYRRQSLASTLTRIAVAFAAESGYSTLYLHTNTLVPGALAYWRRHADEVFDARGTEYDTDPRFETVHFEIPLPPATA